MSTHLRKIDEADQLGLLLFLFNFNLLGSTLIPRKYKKQEEEMENRSRKNQLKIYLNDEELALFREKMKMTNSKTMAHFIKKCVMEKEIYTVDLEPFRNIQWLLSNATNNINQIAKHANQTGVIYRDDIKSIREDIDAISKEVWLIHSLLLNRASDGGK